MLIQKNQSLHKDFVGISKEVHHSEENFDVYFKNQRDKLINWLKTLESYASNNNIEGAEKQSIIKLRYQFQK